jgi:class 3 adenylate cyclase/pimeloyl-ACP methyl ester carboxylesterase
VEWPQAKYANTGDLHVAYWTVGDGPVDIVFVPEWITFIEALWSVPSYERLWERLGSIGRLILTDARGSGSSDPAPIGDRATFEHAVDDLVAVLDAVGSPRAFLIGHTYSSAMMACLFAARHPDRTAGLVLAGGTPSYLDRGDGFGLTPELRDAHLAYIADHWGDPDGAHLHMSMPGPGREDERQREARFERMAMSPATAKAHFEMVFDLDVRAVLPSVKAPSLVVHRTGDRVVSVNAGRYLAEHIEGARFVELPGDEHFWFIGDVDNVLDEITEFITGTRPAVEPDRVLVTVLFTDVVGSTEQAALVGDRRWRDLLDRHDATVRHQLQRFHGREIKTVGDGFLATFDSPVGAIRCACAIRDALRPLGLDVRAGLHTGMVERRNEDIGGIAVHVAQRVSALAAPGEVLVSRTVVDLVAGSDLQFSGGQDHDLKGVPGTWQLFTVEN